MAADARHADWRAHTRAVLDEVFAERERVVDVEGFGPEHDDAHAPSTALSRASACYATAEHLRRQRGLDEPHALTPPAFWPWSPDWWKPTDERRNLIRALQLAVAAVCRLDRDAARAEASRLAVEEAAADGPLATHLREQINRWKTQISCLQHDAQTAAAEDDERSAKVRDLSALISQAEAVLAGMDAGARSK